MSAASARSPAAQRRPAARSSSSAAPCSASSTSPASSAISTACRRSSTRTPIGYLPRDKVVALLTGSQGEPRAALARIADGRPSARRAVAGRHRRLFLARHSRQREGDQPHHQPPDRARHPGHHRPRPRWSTSPAIRAATSCAEMYALAEAADRRSGAWRGRCISPRTPSFAARARRADGARRSRTATWSAWRRRRPSRSTRCRRPPLQGRHAHRRHRRRSASPSAASSPSPAMSRVSLVLDEQRRGRARSRHRADRPAAQRRATAGRSRRPSLDAVLGTLDSIPRPRRRDPEVVREAVRRAVRGAVAEAWGKKPVCTVFVAVV